MKFAGETVEDPYIRNAFLLESTKQSRLFYSYRSVEFVCKHLTHDQGSTSRPRDRREGRQKKGVNPPILRNVAI